MPIEGVPVPLDNRKSSHIQSLLTRSFQGRQKTVVFVYQSGTTYSYTPVSVIFRLQDAFDPQVADRNGNPPRAAFDTLIVAPINTNFSGVVFIADTTTNSTAAVQAAKKYQVVEVVTMGMISGGSRIHAYLRRMN